jgi:mRNA interferase MazF
MTLVCPVTTRNNGFPLHLPLPAELDERYGFVVVEQVRAFDLSARNAQVVVHLDEDAPLMQHVTSLLRSFF